ncbi:MAG: hypothetical protein LBC84_07700 [Prevotellaceae bacterium]|jgi:outer membrane lipoprotein-sorting protein|nr:hypothetical protein [Prevotellaceae bacterium]
MKTKLLTILFIAFCLFGCFQQNNHNAEVVYNNFVRQDTAILISSFLQNTTYIYKGNYSNSVGKYIEKPTLIDLNYTPPQKYTLDNIQIKINGNTAIVQTNRTITHRILSTCYYEVKISYGIYNVAVLKTNRGEINLLEYNEFPNKRYGCVVRYDNFHASSSVFDDALFLITITPILKNM